jgi:uncharacterized protein with PIN domain
MGLKRKFEQFAKKAEKIAKSEGFKNKLREFAKVVKKKVKVEVDARCPECKKNFDFALSQPQVQKFLKGVDQKITKKCKTCGELLDVVIKA